MKKIMVLIFALSLVFSSPCIFAQNNNISASAPQKDLNKANKLARANIEKETKKRQREAKRKKKAQAKAKRKARKEAKRRQRAQEQALDKYRK